MYISAHITALVEHGVGAVLSDLHPDLGAVSTGVRDAPFITRAFLHITINLTLHYYVFMYYCQAQRSAPGQGSQLISLYVYVYN